jgi:hypothetical protein
MILPDSPYTVLVEYLVVLWDGQSPHPATIVEVMILVSADQNKAMTQELAGKKKQENTTKLQILLTCVVSILLTSVVKVNL